MFSIIKRPVKKPEHLLHLGKVDISSIQEFIQKNSYSTMAIRDKKSR